jgi:hypothetical protein
MGINASPDGRLVVQADANRFLMLDRGYATVGNVSAHLMVAPDGSNSVIERIYSWALASRDVVAFADVRTPGINGNERWSTGIVRFSTETERGGFEFLRNMNLPMDTVSRKYHRLGYPYIAGLGETAFYILMDHGAYHLWSYKRGSAPEDLGDLGKLTGFEKLWKDPASLPSYVNSQDYVNFMETVEESSMPTGLYGWKDPVSGSESLYLMSRQRQNGATRWLLTQLDPKSGHGKATAVIGSEANHLFAVPGPSRWAIVEKGPAVGLQEQEVRSIYTIPAAKIRALNGRSGKELRDICQ